MAVPVTALVIQELVGSLDHVPSPKMVSEAAGQCGEGCGGGRLAWLRARSAVWLGEVPHPTPHPPPQSG